jgi:hypothetical protein
MAKKRGLKPKATPTTARAELILSCQVAMLSSPRTQDDARHEPPGGLRGELAEHRDEELLSHPLIRKPSRPIGRVQAG